MIPFEKDTFIPKKILEIKEKFGITTIIETGTQYGFTANWFAENFDNVFTIEADSEFYAISRENLKGHKNLVSMFGKSEDLISEAITQANGNVLFFLDAHGCNIGGTALIQELECIKGFAKDYVICIHDFKVPNKDFGYDTYNGVDLDLDFIKPYLDGLKYEFNTEANGANRGIIYLYGNK